MIQLSLTPDEAEWPTVAVVIPILNEAESLRPTLASVFAQDYPCDRFEVVIVDGGSNDGWQNIVTQFSQDGHRIRALQNSKGNVSAALNLAVRTIDADAILWISGHCLLSADYLRKSGQVLREAERRVTGGALDVTGETLIGRLNATLLVTRFGTGASAFRFDRKPGPTESITFALYRREDILAVGGLDESLSRNQDNDLVDRIKSAGGQYWRVDAVATYLAPRTIGGLLRRAWRNGAWSVWAILRGRRGYSWWHFAPMAMVGIGSAVTLFWFFGARQAGHVLVILAAAYLALAVVSAILVSIKRRTIWAIPLLPLLFFVHHFVYGLGSWYALTKPNPVPIRAAAHLAKI